MEIVGASFVEVLWDGFGSRTCWISGTYSDRWPWEYDVRYKGEDGGDEPMIPSRTSFRRRSDLLVKYTMPARMTNTPTVTRSVPIIVQASELKVAYQVLLL